MVHSSLMAEVNLGREEISFFLIMFFTRFQEFSHWVKIWTVARPVLHLEGLLSQKGLDAHKSVAGGSILEMVHAAVQLHEPQQVVIQHTLVAFSLHCDVIGQKIETTAKILQTYTLFLRIMCQCQRIYKVRLVSRYSGNACCFMSFNHSSTDITVRLDPRYVQLKYM